MTSPLTSGAWLPARDGGVMVDIAFLEPGRGEVAEGSEGHLCQSYALAEVWWLEWQRSHLRWLVTEVRFTEKQGGQHGG